MKKNERGYTLIELIVAITILAIIAIPLMHSFVTAAKTNAKARKIEQATTVAQNVMEEIKATPLESLSEGVEPDRYTIEFADGESMTILSYQLTYEDVMADGVPYHVEVMIDNGPSGDVGLADYNQKEMPQLYDMNAAYDAFFVLEEETDKALIRELATTLGVSDTQVLGDLQRNIYLDIKEAAGTRIVEVNVAYTYQAVTRYMEAENRCIYANSLPDGSLRNIYVFFAPLSNMVEGSAPKEIITVRNACCTKDSKPVQVYLVKQGTQYDENYVVAVNLMEQSREDDSYQAKDGSLKVMTAIYTNLSFPNGVSGETKDQIDLKYSKWDGDYRENISVAGISYTADQIAGLKGLAAEAKQDWTYHVSVGVYEKDADENAEALVYLMGTKEK